MGRRPRARVPVGFPPSAPPARPEDGVGCALAVIAVVVLCALFSWCGGDPPAADAQDLSGLALPARRPHPPLRPIPVCQWDEATKDDLVRMVRVETVDELERFATIPWVLARRWHARGPALRAQTFREHVVAFSRPLRRLHELLDAGVPLEQAAERAGASRYQRRALASTAATSGDLGHALDAWADGSVPGDGCAWSPLGPAFNWRAPHLEDDRRSGHVLACPGYNAYLPPSRDQLAALVRATREECP